MLTYPKLHFLKDHILAPKGCCALKFLHELENDQMLIAPSHCKRGPFLQLFQRGGSKIGLKCNKLALITSELRDVARRDFGT